LMAGVLGPAYEDEFRATHLLGISKGVGRTACTNMSRMDKMLSWRSASRTPISGI
jgi:hypothetical protein